MARYLLRDGNKVAADVCPATLDVVTYVDLQGHEIHALASVKAEKKLLSQVPAKLLPLVVRMNQGVSKTAQRVFS